MRYVNCIERGFAYESNGRVYLNEDKFFRQMSYDDCLELEFNSRSIDVGCVDINDVENFLERKRPK
jgi:hypothetical protein